MFTWGVSSCDDRCDYHNLDSEAMESDSKVKSEYDYSMWRSNSPYCAVINRGKKAIDLRDRILGVLDLTEEKAIQEIREDHTRSLPRVRSLPSQ